MDMATITMNLRQTIGIILLIFSVLLYLAGYLFIVNRAPNPFANALQFLNNMLSAFVLLLIGIIVMFIGAVLLAGAKN